MIFYTIKGMIEIHSVYAKEEVLIAFLKQGGDPDAASVLWNVEKNMEEVTNAVHRCGFGNVGGEAFADGQ